MALNIEQLKSELQNVPEKNLLSYIQMPNGQVPQYLALAEIQRRQTIKQEAASQEAPQTTVAEDLTGPQQNIGMGDNPTGYFMPEGEQQEENPEAGGEDQGLGSLDVPEQAMPQMAGGGIVAFADGGEAEEPTRRAKDPSLKEWWKSVLLGDKYDYFEDVPPEATKQASLEDYNEKDNKGRLDKEIERQTNGKAAGGIIGLAGGGDPVEQMLRTVNVARAQQGLPPLSREEYEQQQWVVGSQQGRSDLPQNPASTEFNNATQPIREGIGSLWDKVKTNVLQRSDVPSVKPYTGPSFNPAGIKTSPLPDLMPTPDMVDAASSSKGVPTAIPGAASSSTSSRNIKGGLGGLNASSTGIPYDPTAPTFNEADLSGLRNLVGKEPTLQQSIDSQNQLEQAFGIDKDLYKKQREGFDKEAAALGESRDQDMWMRVAEAGLGWMSSKSPYALQGLGEGATPAIKGAMQDIKDIRKEKADIRKQQMEVDRAEDAMLRASAKGAWDDYNKAKDKREGLLAKMAEIQAGEADRKNKFSTDIWKQRANDATEIQKANIQKDATLGAAATSAGAYKDTAQATRETNNITRLQIARAGLTEKLNNELMKLDGSSEGMTMGMLKGRYDTLQPTQKAMVDAFEAKKIAIINRIQKEADRLDAQINAFGGNMGGVQGGSVSLPAGTKVTRTK